MRGSWKWGVWYIGNHSPNVWVRLPTYSCTYILRQRLWQNYVQLRWHHERQPLSQQYPERCRQGSYWPCSSVSRARWQRTLCRRQTAASYTAPCLGRRRRPGRGTVRWRRYLDTQIQTPWHAVVNWSFRGKTRGNAVPVVKEQPQPVAAPALGIHQVLARSWKYLPGP